MLPCLNELEEAQQLFVLYWKTINPHLPSGPVHPCQLKESIPDIRGVWCTFSFLFYFKSMFLLANSEDPDQMPHSAASDLGLHCLPMSQKWYTRLIWVKQTALLKHNTALQFHFISKALTKTIQIWWWSMWYWGHIFPITVYISGWLGQAMVLGSFPCQGFLLLLHIVGQGPAVLAAGAGQVGCFFLNCSFRLSYLPFLMLHLLGDGWT